MKTKKLTAILFLLLLALLCGCTISNPGQENTPTTTKDSTTTQDTITTTDGDTMTQSTTAPIYPVTDNKVSYIEALRHIYKETELDKIRDFKGDDTVNELIKAYPPEFIRFDGYDYSFYYRSKTSLVVCHIGGENLGLVRKYNINGRKIDFDAVEVGMALTEVQALFPEGDFMFLFTGVGWPRTIRTPEGELVTIYPSSEHYTIDGYLITIEYSEDSKVRAIKKEFV